MQRHSAISNCAANPQMFQRVPAPQVKPILMQTPRVRGPLHKRTLQLTDLIRVNVLIAERSGLSRRGADTAIANSRVTTGGRTVALGERLDALAPLELDGKELTAKPRPPVDSGDALVGAEVFAWYKPVGVTTTHADPYATVTLPQALSPALGAERAARVLSIGRLDRESEGLLLLTEERRVVSPLAHPRAGLRRAYAVATKAMVGESEFQRLRAGIRLTDGWAHAIEARGVQRNDDLPADVRSGDMDPGQWSFISIGEGRHHEVRRLYGAISHPVLRLIRVGYGPVRLGGLSPGELRPITDSERQELVRVLAAAAMSKIRSISPTSA
ncbi:MAG: rRNA pseudouridine synthase [bacterium]|nr:rRNA pseudouridine synthase [Candidatus Aquidulcis sp.]